MSHSFDILRPREFLDALLALWLRHADNPDGLFHPDFDREWRRRGGEKRTLVSQCRLIYNFARGYERSGDAGYADAVRRGLAALERHFRDAQSENYGWFWDCDAKGTVRDDTFDAYGHAFVVLACATAARALRDERYLVMALGTWRFMQRCFGDEHGGLVWHVGQGGQTRDDLRSQNPVMHTFEALLALAPLDESGGVGRDAARIWRFVSARRLDSGALPEWYDAVWQPLSAGPRAGVDIGHAFEWAFLLSEAHVLVLGDDLLCEAQRFLDFGLAHGYDTEAGGIFSETDLEGRLKTHHKGWWQQCEAIRTLRRFAVHHGVEKCREPLRRSLAFAQQHYVDSEFGGWYANPPGMSAAPCLDKGNPYKLDYHVVNMCLELELEKPIA